MMTNMKAMTLLKLTTEITIYIGMTMMRLMMTEASEDDGDDGHDPNEGRGG